MAWLDPGALATFFKIRKDATPRAKTMLRPTEKLNGETLGGDLLKAACKKIREKIIGVPWNSCPALRQC